MTDANVLYPSAAVPAAPSTDTPAPVADGPNHYNEAMRETLKEAVVVDGATPEELEGLRSHLAEAFHAVEITTPEASKILDALMKEEKTPATPEQVTAWQEETRRALHAQYGADAPERLRRANAIVARSPALAQMLRESGLGNRLDIVQMFVERAYR
jgi:hypothetical protein